MTILYKPLIILIGLILLFGTKDLFACRAPKASPATLVDGAEVIVRAEAQQYVDEPPRSDLRYLNEPTDATISFKVGETLKGTSVPKEIILNGYLTDTDDFNEGEIPYDFVGRSGGGSCSAYEYKQGAEFLLFLRKINGKYTVRWYPLAPTNEQLRSVDDKWLNWVRHYLKASRNKTSVKPVT